MIFPWSHGLLWASGVGCSLNCRWISALSWTLVGYRDQYKTGMEHGWDVKGDSQGWNMALHRPKGSPRLAALYLHPLHQLPGH